jgi:hypothetical protein
MRVAYSLGTPPERKATMNRPTLRDATREEAPMNRSTLQDAARMAATMNRSTLSMVIGGVTVLVVWLGLWITSTGMLVYSANISPLGTRDCRYLVGVKVHKRYERRTQHCPFFRSAEAASTVHRETRSSAAPAPRSSAAPAPRSSAAPAPRSSTSSAPVRRVKASAPRTRRASSEVPPP